MTTLVQIVGDALRELNVIPEGVEPDGDQGKHGLRRLNQMLEMWTEDGVELGHFKQSSTTADITIPEWAELGVIMMLAIQLAPHYGASISPELIDSADRAYGTLLRKSVVEKTQPLNMNHLPVGDGQWGRGRNILTDT